MPDGTSQQQDGRSNDDLIVNTFSTLVSKCNHHRDVADADIFLRQWKTSVARALEPVSNRAGVKSFEDFRALKKCLQDALHRLTEELPDKMNNYQKMLDWPTNCYSTILSCVDLRYENWLMKSYWSKLLRFRSNTFAILQLQNEKFLLVHDGRIASCH